MFQFLSFLSVSIAFVFTIFITNFQQLVVNDASTSGSTGPHVASVQSFYACFFDSIVCTLVTDGDVSGMSKIYFTISIDWTMVFIERMWNFSISFFIILWWKKQEKKLKRFYWKKIKRQSRTKALMDDYFQNAHHSQWKLSAGNIFKVFYGHVLASKAQPMQMRAIDIICTFILPERGSVFDVIFGEAKYRKKHNFRISEGGIGGHFFALFMELTPKQSHVLKNKQH